MSTSSQRVLLTGGAGFIGSHVAEALLRQRTELTIIDNLDDFYSPVGKRSNLEEIRRVGPWDDAYGVPWLPHIHLSPTGGLI